MLSLSLYTNQCILCGEHIHQHDQHTICLDMYIVHQNCLYNQQNQERQMKSYNNKGQSKKICKICDMIIDKTQMITAQLHKQKFRYHAMCLIQFHTKMKDLSQQCHYCSSSNGLLCKKAFKKFKTHIKAEKLRLFQKSCSDYNSSSDNNHANKSCIDYNSSSDTHQENKQCIDYNHQRHNKMKQNVLIPTINKNCDLNMKTEIYTEEETQLKYIKQKVFLTNYDDYLVDIQQHTQIYINNGSPFVLRNVYVSENHIKHNAEKVTMSIRKWLKFESDDYFFS